MNIIRRHCLGALAAAALGLAGASAAQALTVKDDHGELTLQGTPQRIVALEFSFVDALANVGISPVGVADDNQPSRIIAPVRARIKPWTSVGTRSQPSMEAIAQLKPGLIIADTNRHSASYGELSKIAPVLLLNSRYGSFADILTQAQLIADVVGKSKEMAAQITRLNEKISEVGKQLPAGTAGHSGMFVVSRENSLDVFSSDTFAGGLLTRLGFVLPPKPAGKDIFDMDLEHVMAINPDWLFVAHYRQESIVRKWQQQPLWSALKVARSGQQVSVDPELWARSRGLLAAHLMADQVQQALAGHRSGGK